MNDMWLQYFSTIPDPRTGNRKVHKLVDILAIAIIATLCGEDDWVGVEEFARSREDWLRTFLELPYGLPSHDTLHSVASFRCCRRKRSSRRSWPGRKRFSD